jgi:hypothetical protein
MRRYLCLLAGSLLALPCHAQFGGLTRAGLPRLLDFEAERAIGVPQGWGGGPNETIFVDHDVVHGGKTAARLERNASSANPFSTLTLAVPIDFAGKTIEYRGFVRTQDVSDYVSLWIREDGESGSLEFETTQNLQVKGTTDWKEYSLRLPVHADARTLVFGVVLSGAGKAWADDLTLLVDGKPIWDAPEIVRPKTVLETDTEFDAGSGIHLSELTRVQTANLATLGKVWGFLKYHHPSITSGQRHWDYDLFRVMPAILAAPGRAAANAALAKWVADVGPVAPCKTCASLDAQDLHLRPNLAWISDEARLGAALSKSLREIHANRPADGKQFYVSLMPNVRNPSFDHELAYARLKLPDAGFQILAVYRFWNMIEYWYPDRDVIGENWDAVLGEMLPRVALAKEGDTYKREMMALIARVHDTHANLWSSINVRPPVGTCQLPVAVRFIGKSAVIWDVLKTTDLERGDVISELDGTPVATLVEKWRPYYAASNDATVLRDIGVSMTHGACGEAKVKVQRNGKEVAVTTERVPIAGLPLRNTHDRPGDTFQMLGDDVAYMKLSSVASNNVAGYIDSAAKTKGLIIDIRNYPKEFVVFTLGGLLMDQPTDFAMFTSADLANPGAFHFRSGDRITPRQPHYSGKIVILVDEVSLSQAEYTAMAFRAAPGAKVIGSTTAGADGNVSAIPLPGGLRSMLSGLGVFYPDKTPTQRVGILPDIEVKPTIEGIRAGRDEVLERAVLYIRGK